jgi:hypothetical protein
MSPVLDMTQIYDPAPLALGDPPTAAARRRRPAIPGRAALGALLVVVATVGTWSLQGSGSAGPSTHYVVASHALPAGATLTAADLELRAMDLPQSTADASWRALDQVVGLVTLGPLGSGELVQRANLAPQPGGAGDLHEITLPVEPGSVPPGLRSGERIDLLATHGSGTDAYTEVVAPSARFLSHDTGDDGAFVTGGSATLTLGVAPADVLAVVHAARTASITIVRTTGTGEAEARGPFRPSPPDEVATGDAGSGDDEAGDAGDPGDAGDGAP